MTKMTLKEKIRKARREIDFSQSVLAKKINLSLRTLQRFEEGLTVPDVEELKKISTATNKPLAYFLEESPKFEIKNFSDAQMPVKRIPLISWVLANRFGEAADPLSPGEADEWLYTTAKGSRMFALKVKSDCMEPEFREGDRIIVDPDGQAENGSYVIVRDNKNNEATFKQLKKYGKKIVLHPLNPKYPDIELAQDKRYVIVGKVVGKDKKY